MDVHSRGQESKQNRSTHCRNTRLQSPYRPAVRLLNSSTVLKYKTSLFLGFIYESFYIISVCVSGVHGPIKKTLNNLIVNINKNRKKMYEQTWVLQQRLPAMLKAKCSLHISLFVTNSAVIKYDN